MIGANSAQTKRSCWFWQYVPLQSARESDTAVCATADAKCQRIGYCKGCYDRISWKQIHTCEAISGINSASKVSTIYHAGTKNKDGQILTNGGRVLGVSALGDSLSDASSAAYKACDMIQWKNKYCRADIGRQS